VLWSYVFVVVLVVLLQINYIVDLN